ncbi:16S rRNA (adenine(1518)-N(6)/adenine(1519)-N(6))-dimethyltransferase RsmA [Desulfopila inferna]|uniref:16S rRNA (adenine(1518)-N(6)/adenine(1519)-N(6))- dimethyltransferase RsmA n=1 Tax=Desulfopila inferna TaxID=468528 RepID=UPI00196406BD|nr:16S rRNA (adenine(1518)-N(6)/adenine(1519)-N(6))-dimethyltransferase RsmA [Desulfopila inferna]MBM9602782.1 ribosomal RNA small subunit methyltransferase A [Desulfopila inferna]
MIKKTEQQKLRQHNLAPSKRLGQNFLINPHTAESIVDRAAVNRDDVIIEVGVGLGALTAPLAEQAKKVIGIEIDSGLIRYHSEENDLPENVSLIHGDILRANFADLVQQSGAKLKIIANLPYSISNPFIFKLVDNSEYIDWVVVMLQKEVAERLMSAPSSKEYGIPTILLGSCARVNKIMLIRPQEFHPQPKIDSLVIRLDFYSQPHLELNLPSFDPDLFRRVVRAGFAKRRKTLLNNLSDFCTGFGEKKRAKIAAAEAIRAAGLDAGERAENLTLLDFVHLTKAIAEMMTDSKEAL